MILDVQNITDKIVSILSEKHQKVSLNRKMKTIVFFSGNKRIAEFSREELKQHELNNTLPNL